ncbi:MAG: hypothetical protein ABI462_04625 [Ignavibacteria bacterium]
MYTFKIYRTAILMLVLSILAGCSDEITSPVTESGGHETAIKQEAQENLSTNFFHGKVLLKPRQSYSFSYENTGFYRFNAVSVTNCEDIKNDIEVTGYMDDEAITLGCSTKDFWVKSITVTNISGHKTEIDIYLTGTKIRVSEPGPGIINAN